MILDSLSDMVSSLSSKEEQRQARDFFKTYIDARNIATAQRLKKYPDADSEYISSLLLLHGTVSLKKLNSIIYSGSSFGNKLKDNTIAFGHKLVEIGNIKVEFDVFKYNVSRLQNQPVSELKSLLANELQGVSNE